MNGRRAHWYDAVPGGVAVVALAGGLVLLWPLGVWHGLAGAVAEAVWLTLPAGGALAVWRLLRKRERRERE